MADIFISYKSERRAAAEHLAEILADYGYSVWWDYELVSGGDFGLAIEKELRAAKAVVVLWCAMSVESEWVREEATLAKRASKVIPALIEKGVDPPLGFSLKQTLDLSDWNGAPKSGQLDRLVRDVGQLVGRAPRTNMEGLERTERAWRRFGAPSLREFALSEALERKLPPRTIHGELLPENRDAPAGDWRLPAVLAAALGVAVLVAVAVGSSMRSTPGSTTESVDATIAGNWTPPGVSCEFATRFYIEGDTLKVIAPHVETEEFEIVRRLQDGIVTDRGSIYLRFGTNLVLREGGNELIYTPCDTQGL